MASKQATIFTRTLLRQASNRVSCATNIKVCPAAGVGFHTSSKMRKSTAPQEVQKSALETLKERGLYNKTLLRHYKFKPTELSIAEDGKHVNITWEDGHKSRLHAVWLRHNCHSPENRLDHNGMICSGPQDIDVNIKVISAAVEDDEILVLKWQYSDGVRTHEGPIPLAYLRKYCNSPSALEQRSKAIAMTFHKEKVIPEVLYEEVMHTQEGLYQWLCALEERGICLLKECPQTEGIVQKAAERIALVQHTIYGEVFDVYSKPEPINAAYSPVKLELHMDQPQYENPPGLQLLHCIKFDPDIIGGDNTFADIFEIALQLRAERPDYFDILTKIPVTMNTIQYFDDFQEDMTKVKPLFELNNDGELISVLWHPMLTDIHLKDQEIEPFFAAYKHFFQMIDEYKSIYSMRMVAGDMITFNNRRALHGRASYFNQKGVRWLQGTYVELSEFRSRLQVLHNTIGDGRPAKRVGLSCWN